MQALKGLVVGLGALIVIGILGVAYGFYIKLSNPDGKLLKASVQETPPPLISFGEMRVSLPEGCTVIEMRPEGNRLYLRTGPSGVCERIVIVDSSTGDIVGTLILKPDP